MQTLPRPAQPLPGIAAAYYNAPIPIAAGENCPMPPPKSSLLMTVVVALSVVALFAAACANEPSAPPTLEPATRPAIADSSTPPNLSADIAAPVTELEFCPEHGYCARLDLGGRLTAAAWLDEDRMYLADFEGRIRLLDVKTGVVTMALDGLSIPRGLTVLERAALR